MVKINHELKDKKRKQKLILKIGPTKIIYLCEQVLFLKKSFFQIENLFLSYKIKKYRLNPA